MCDEKLLWLSSTDLRSKSDWLKHWILYSAVDVYKKNMFAYISATWKRIWYLEVAKNQPTGRSCPKNCVGSSMSLQHRRLSVHNQTHTGIMGLPGITFWKLRKPTDNSRVGVVRPYLGRIKGLRACVVEAERERRTEEDAGEGACWVYNFMPG